MLDLRAGEVRVEHEPGLRGSRLGAVRLQRSQIGAVRGSCQTMARWTGSPVARSHTTVVSRWLVMPMAAMSAAGEARSARAPRARARQRVDQMSSGSCSTQPAAEDLRELLLRGRDPAPRRSNTMARLEVVP